MLHYRRRARLRSRTDLSLTPQPDPPSASHSTLHPYTWTFLLSTLQHQHTIQHSTLLSTLQYKPGNPAFAILFIHITDRYLYILQEKFTILCNTCLLSSLFFHSTLHLLLIPDCSLLCNISILSSLFYHSTLHPHTWTYLLSILQYKLAILPFFHSTLHVLLIPAYSWFCYIRTDI